MGVCVMCDSDVVGVVNEVMIRDDLMMYLNVCEVMWCEVMWCVVVCDDW